MTAATVSSANVSHDDEQAGTLDVDRQVRYFLRCLKTLLPTQYTPNDSNRMSLAFFTISALDLLDALDKHTTPTERKDYIDWIYLNQHPDGGFRAFPGANLGPRRDRDNAQWDPATVPATYFALSMLLILDDNLSRVTRDKCLTWLSNTQDLNTGAFCETTARATSDSRFGYCAAAIWYILGAQLEPSSKHQLDVDAFVRYIRSAEVRL